MEPIVSSETSAIRTQTPGNYPKRNNLHLQHGESLKRRLPTVTSIEAVTCILTLLYDSPSYIYAFFLPCIVIQLCNVKQ